MNRADRLKSPEFDSIMEKEKRETIEALKNLGGDTLHLGYNAILETPAKMMVSAFKSKGLESYMKKTFGLFLGKNGVMHNTGKVVASAIKLGAKCTKIGVRRLFVR